MRLSLPLLMVFAGKALAAEAPARAAPPDLGGAQLLETAGGLLLVLALLLGLAWLAKRFMGAPGVGKGRVQVIGGVSLGPRERAVIVEVEGQRLLLGVAQGNVRLLRELPGGPQSAFSETLAQTAGGEGAA